MSIGITGVLVRGMGSPRELSVTVEWGGGIAALFWLLADGETAARALSKATPGCVHTLSWTHHNEGRKSLDYLNGECVG